MRGLVIALVACSTAQPIRRSAPQTASPVDGHPITVAGETMEYRVAFRGITVGRVVVAVGEPGIVDGRHAVIFRARGTSDGLAAVFADLTWELTSTVDVETGTVIHSVEEAWAHAPGGHDEHDREEIDEGYDLVAAVSTVRGLPVGVLPELEVHLGGGHIPVELDQAGVERVPGQAVLGLRFDGEAFSDKHFTVWLSDDAARVLLRGKTETELGDVEVTLVDYHAPAG